MATLRFDEEAARKLGAAYMTADLVEQRRATLRWLSLQPGDSILDVGCGPGFLCAELAEAVGEGGRVLGIDISDDLLAFATSANKRPWLTFRHGDAGALDLQNSSFDAAVMAQVLEYVVDTDACLAELHRILRPGGRLLVIDTDWDGVIWHTTGADRMTRIKLAWEEHCVEPRLPRTLVARLRSAGFGPVTVTGFPIINTRFDPTVLSYGLVGLMVDFLARRETVAAEDLKDWVADLEALEREGRYFFSLLRCVFIASRT